MAAPDDASFSAFGRPYPDSFPFTQAGWRWPGAGRRPGGPGGVDDAGRAAAEAALLDQTVLVGSTLDEGRFRLAEQTDSAATTVYDVLCPLEFHQAVMALTEQRDVSPSQLVHQVLALVHPAMRATMADPGVADLSVGGGDDRTDPATDTVSAVLTLTLDPGLAHSTIRQALAVALALASPRVWSLRPAAEAADLRARVEKLEYRTGAQTQALEKISFRPHDRAIGSVTEAIKILGLDDASGFDEQQVTRRFRELAPIYHPDTGVLPCRRRMAMLIEARKLLLEHLRSRPAGPRGRRF